MPAWNRTTLSTDPATIEMADTDRRPLAISAGETITGVSTKIVNYDQPDIELDDLVESSTLNDTNDGALVWVSGLTRGVFYELSTIFTSADGEIWTKTTLIKCVA